MNNKLNHLLMMCAMYEHRLVTLRMIINVGWQLQSAN